MLLAIVSYHKSKMVSFSVVRMIPFALLNSASTTNSYKLHSSSPTVCSCKEASPRRNLIIGAISIPLLTFLNYESTLLPVLAEETPNSLEENDESVVGALKSLFDPNEKTKRGKVLPKAYLKSAREVVKALRESLNEDTKDNAKFRRTADSAKESIRGYLSDWRGQKEVINEESYAMIEKAIRSLASFYSKAGPSAALPEKVKSEILTNLTTADEFL